MTPRMDRIGEVWAHVDQSRPIILLILRDDTRRAKFRVERELLFGWTCLNLETGVIDWLPDSAFYVDWWRRIA